MAFFARGRTHNVRLWRRVIKSQITVPCLVLVYEITFVLREIAIDAATGTIGTGLTYVGVGAAVAGVSIPVAGQVAMGVVGTVCGIWGLYRIGKMIYQNIS